jgi:hypothetical protein
LAFLLGALLPSGKTAVQIVQSEHKPKPSVSLARFTNPQRETARHEYFSLWSLLETAMGGSRAAARGGLFKFRYNISNKHGEK